MVGKALSITAFVFSILSLPLLIFIPFAYLIGLVLGIIAIVQSKKDKNSLKGLAIAAVVISIIFLILNIAGATYVFNERFRFDYLKQSITIDNVGGLTEDELYDVRDFIAYRLELENYSDIQFGKRNNKIMIKFNDYNKGEILDLLVKSKFMAKIGDTEVLNKNDIKFVCRDDTCSGIDPTYGCKEIDDEYSCRYMFKVEFTQEAANKIAEITKDLKIIELDGEEYLNKNLTFFIDNHKIHEVMISKDLQGNPITEIVMSDTITGKTEQDAVYNALSEMEDFQILMSVGSIPDGINLI